jgi:hypothetical protein
MATTLERVFIHITFILRIFRFDPLRLIIIDEVLQKIS